MTPWGDDPDHGAALALLCLTAALWTWACWSGHWRALTRRGDR